MDEDVASLQKAITDYESQLSQIQLAIASSIPGPDRDNLVSLRLDIEELITLTKENLLSVQNQENGGVSSTQTSEKDAIDHFDREYALLKAELEETESAEDHRKVNIQEDLNALQGMKCQAPHCHQWGEVSYHNALVFSVEQRNDISTMDQIQVRVMFTNPTHQDMLPCPFYLEGECRFSEQQCRFSHGELVQLSSLKEYKEPDFSAVRSGVRVLVKQNDKLWHRGVVLTSSSKNRCEVKLESSGKKAEVSLDCILPLDSGQDSSEEDSDDGSEEDSDIELDPMLVQQSLLATPASTALGEWEKHTKGIGSRLMAQMGYVVGTGLGRNGEGRIEPVEAMIFPAGKSLDHCMTLREQAGGDENLFKVEKRLKRLQRKQERQSERQYERQKQRTNVFDFINSKLGGKKGDIQNLLPVGSQSSSKDTRSIKSESSQGLNVIGFRVGEEIRRAERDLSRLKESLSRHSQGSSTHKTIMSKMEDKQGELAQLRASERSIDLERNQRKDRKKLTVF